MQASQIQHILIEEAIITNRHILQVYILAQINLIIFPLHLLSPTVITSTFRGTGVSLQQSDTLH